MRSLLVIGSLLLLIVIVGCRGSEPPKSLSPQQAASDAMGVLQKLINDQNYRALGFDSVDEVKQARMGQPLAVSNIGLDQLKNYQSGSKVSSLLSKSSETIYPVTVNGQVKSSVTIVQKEGGYQPASFGNSDVIKSLSRYSQGEPAANDFVVRVLALNMYFLGRQNDDRLFLIPVIDDPRLKLRPGEAVPAEIVVQQLVPLANAYNGLPL